MTVDPVLLEVVDRVAHLTLARPDRRNALDLAAFARLAERVAELEGRPDVGAVVVAGADGAFCAGLDVSVLTGSSGPTVDAGTIAGLQAAFDAVEDLEVPTIAAIEGPCIGAGLQLALACHLRAVAPSAVLALAEVEWGLVPDLGATTRLPRLVGLGRATELALTARRVAAADALAIGLAEVALPADDPLGAAHALAARLAAGPAAVRRLPGLLRDNAGRDRAHAHAAEVAAQLACLAGPDVAEAVAARREARPPRFTGG